MWPALQGVDSNSLSSAFAGSGAKLVYVANERCVAEDLPQGALVHAQIHSGAVAIHHRRDGRIKGALDAQFRSQGANARGSPAYSESSERWR